MILIATTLRPVRPLISSWTKRLQGQTHTLLAVSESSILSEKAGCGILTLLNTWTCCQVKSQFWRLSSRTIYKVEHIHPIRIMSVLQLFCITGLIRYNLSFWNKLQLLKSQMHFHSLLLMVMIPVQLSPLNNKAAFVIISKQLHCFALILRLLNLAMTVCASRQHPVRRHRGLHPPGQRLLPWGTGAHAERTVWKVRPDSKGESSLSAEASGWFRLLVPWRKIILTLKKIKKLFWVLLKLKVKSRA